MKLRLQNFKCYEDETFDLGENGLVLISAPSGYGKTSILSGIYFALFGTGSKVISHGKTSCSVELEFDDLKIIRTKGPKRLVVNDVYINDAGQDIINRKLGDTFDVTGYIAQNALNSFILMSPIDKLAFLEKFAFKDVNLTEIKTKCKTIISETKEKLIRVTSQLEMATNMLSELEEPKKVSFPIKCKKENIDKVIKNEEIKYKNSNILIKRSRKTIIKLQKQLNDLKILKASLEAREESLKNIEEKLVQLSQEISDVSFEGEEKLNEYKDKLEKVLKGRELILLRDRLEGDLEKLNDMREEESKEMESKLKNIEDRLWQEYTKEDFPKILKEFEESLKEMEQVEELKVIMKKNYIELDSLKKNEKELEDYKVELDEKKRILETIRLQKESYVCPSCSSNLRFQNEELVLSESFIEGEYNEKEIKEEIKTISSIIKRLNNLIPLQKEKYEKYLEAKRQYNSIYEEDTEEEEIDLKDDSSEEMSKLNTDIEYLREYKRAQIQLEKEKDKLQTKLRKGEFSSSFMSFEKKVLELENKVKKLENNYESKEDIDMTEEELRQKIIFEEQNRAKLESNEMRRKSLEKEKEKYILYLENLKNEFETKYTERKSKEELEREISEQESEIANQEDNLQRCESVLEKIEKWKNYNEKLEEYNKWNSKVNLLREEEMVCRKKHGASLLLKEKILEAESVAMLNIISSINTHAQLYLDCFFPDNPMIARLMPFKETKKSKKPQINIEIEYKGMECDLSILSGGELSRVILAYTLALGEMFNTPLLLLDECTASLDQDLTTVVFDNIRTNFTGKMVIIIAHQVVTGTFDKTIKLD